MTLLALLLLGPTVGKPPAEWKLSPFYKKCIMLEGLPIVSSEKVPDRALEEAYRLAKIMLARIPEARKELIRQKVRIAVMAVSEQTLDIPEHSDLQRVFPQTDWNKRARGLGPTAARPAISAAEENLLRLPGDRYRGESIFIHEFSHAIMEMGLGPVRKGFLDEVKSCYDQAMKEKLWAKTYAATNPSEYWAEAVQSYFDCNMIVDPPNGIHNDVASPEKLKAYDPRVYRLIESVFGPNPYRWRNDPLRP